MNVKKSYLCSAVLLSCSSPIIADDHIETITIVNKQEKLSTATELASGQTLNPDATSWLESIPGAGVNQNGPVTGIAQYRGLFGDRVSVKLNGHHVIGSGPNAMDAPMSYVAPIAINKMTAYRGLAPVSAGLDTLGGAIAVDMKQANIIDSTRLQASGLVEAGYQQLGDSTNMAGLYNLSDSQQGILLYLNSARGDDRELSNGERLLPSQYHKTQFGLDYRRKHQLGTSGVSYHRTDTEESGTAALPMDIDYIEADRLSASGNLQLSNWAVNWSLGYMDSKHGMDNFSQRKNMMAEMHRYNTAAAESYDFKLNGSTNLTLGELTLGVDGYSASHDSAITNPNNAMFNIANFNDVINTRLSAFAELDTGNVNFGVRVKQNEADAGEVSHHMASGMMANPNIKSLQDSFNSQNKGVSETNFDLVLNWRGVINPQSKFTVGTAIKQRAPSYQERYLWVPMQATGGLADGRTYIGDINLDSETAYQLNIGYQYRSNGFSISPHIFYQQIDDYIQATPSSNMAANMVSTMMTGAAPLQFSNVEAELYGLDVRAAYQVNEQVFINAVSSYVRGERKDIDDNLYRIAAPNLKITTLFIGANWQTAIKLNLVAEQDQISELNDEQRSKGYATIDANIQYFWEQLTLESGVDNLFNKEYRDHLSGINRAAGSAIQVGDTIPSTGRNVYLKLNYHF